MELTDIIMATAVRRVYGDSQPSVFLPEVANFMQDQYKFIKYPQTIEDFSTSTSVSFEYGKFFEGAVIKSVSLFSDGVFVQAPVASAQLDLLIDDILSKLEAEFGIVSSGTRAARYYLSQVECRFKPGFTAWFKQLTPVLEAMQDSAAEAGVENDGYEVGGFTLLAEGSGTIKPGRFVLERRAEQPLSANMFFCEAPLSTEALAEMLVKVEALF